jgi:hypothetical protein
MNQTSPKAAPIPSDKSQPSASPSLDKASLVSTVAAVGDPELGLGRGPRDHDSGAAQRVLLRVQVDGP